MDKLKRFVLNAIPTLWAVCWVILITALSVGGAITSVKWLLRALGVM